MIMATHKAWREQVHRFLAGALGITVAPQKNIEGWVQEKRAGTAAAQAADEGLVPSTEAALAELLERPAPVAG